MRREGNRTKDNRRKGKGREYKPSETQTHTWWEKQGISEQGNNNEEREQKTNVCSQPLFQIAEKKRRKKNNRLA
jgi:hypothetical protein